MSEHDFWQAILYVHLLAMAFFVGGQLVFGLAVVPVLRGDADRERMRVIARRFGFGSLIALGVLIVTGWAPTTTSSATPPCSGSSPWSAP
jgi:putative copper export protein